MKAQPKTEREALAECLKHYELMAHLFATLAAGDGVEIEGRDASYADFEREMRGGMAMCARVLASTSTAPTGA